MIRRCCYCGLFHIPSWNHCATTREQIFYLWSTIVALWEYDK